MVMLKYLEAKGFVFYTNLESDHGRPSAARSYAEICFMGIHPAGRPFL